MLHRLVMLLLRQSWRDVAWASVERHLEENGEATDREILVTPWQLRRRVWVRVGPGPEERRELAPLRGLVAGRGGWRRMRVDVARQKVVEILWGGRPRQTPCGGTSTFTEATRRSRRRSRR